LIRSRRMGGSPVEGPGPRLVSRPWPPARRSARKAGQVSSPGRGRSLSAWPPPPPGGRSREARRGRRAPRASRLRGGVPSVRTCADPGVHHVGGAGVARLADHYRKRGAHVCLGGLHVTSLPEEAAAHAGHDLPRPGRRHLAGLSRRPARGAATAAIRVAGPGPSTGCPPSGAT